MITFIKQTIHYDAVASLIQKSIGDWNAGPVVTLDETVLTADELALLKRYLEQENYKQNA